MNTTRFDQEMQNLDDCCWKVLSLTNWCCSWDGILLFTQHITHSWVGEHQSPKMWVPPWWIKMCRSNIGWRHHFRQSSGFVGDIIAGMMLSCCYKGNASAASRKHCCNLSWLLIFQVMQLWTMFYIILFHVLQYKTILNSILLFFLSLYCKM